MPRSEPIAQRGSDSSLSVEIGDLVGQVRNLVQTARRSAVASINSLQVQMNYEIGRLIVQHEQAGKARAQYGKDVLGQVSVRLTEEFGKGFSRTNLEYMRKFYRLWSEGPNSIPQTMSEESPLGFVGRLSWSHYVLLMTLNDDAERRYYEIESANNDWSLPQLKRQISSALYERFKLN